MTDEQLYGSRYQILDLIGDGGMARVFTATDTRLERTVAVKILREQFTSEPQFVERFRQEARLAAGLAHPNIVGVYDVGEEHGRHYMVMEYVAGENLKQVISREAPMPLSTVIAFMRQLAAALDYAHSHGVVHRDIKPENILVTDKREVKVGDFGIARALAGSAMTATGTVLGSVSYFSPEQASGLPASAESDLYSAGMVLYEMLTGHVPFSGPNPVAVAMAQVNDPPALPTNFVPDLPRAVEAVVLKAIAKEPSQRFHSGYDLVAALTEAGRAAAAAPPVVPPARKARANPEFETVSPTMVAAAPVAAAVARRPRRSNAGAVAALLTTAVLLIAAVLVFRSLSGGGSTASDATATPTPLQSSATPGSRKPTLVPVVVPSVAGSPTETFVVPPDTSTPVPSATPQPTSTPVDTVVSALPTATVADSPTPVDTATAVDTDTPGIPSETPTVEASATLGTGTPSPVSGSATATPGSSHGASVDLVTASSMGKHFTAVGVKTEFTAGTSVVYAVAKIHGKAKGDSLVFTWHYPDGSTYPFEVSDVAPYKGDVTAFAQLTPRGAGTYTVTTTINGTVLASVSFSVSAASATPTGAGAETATPSIGALSSSVTPEATVVATEAATETTLGEATPAATPGTPVATSSAEVTSGTPLATASVVVTDTPAGQ